MAKNFLFWNLNNVEKHISIMANIAEARIRREFKEVVKSEEVQSLETSEKFQPYKRR